MIWIPVDKNARKIAAVCPVRLKYEIDKCFIQDKKHFTLITDNVNDILEKSYVKLVMEKLNKNWLSYTWKNKQKFLPNLSVTIKLDGIRFRPLGMFHRVPFVKLLSYISRGLCCIIENSGLKTFTLFRTIDLKQIIKDLDELCNKNDFEIDYKVLDIKNFFTEVQLKYLIPRLRFVLSRYGLKNHTNFVYHQILPLLNI